MGDKFHSWHEHEGKHIKVETARHSGKMQDHYKAYAYDNKEDQYPSHGSHTSHKTPEAAVDSAKKAMKKPRINPESANMKKAELFKAEEDSIKEFTLKKSEKMTKAEADPRPGMKSRKPNDSFTHENHNVHIYKKGSRHYATVMEPGYGFHIKHRTEGHDSADDAAQAATHFIDHSKKK